MSAAEQRNERQYRDERHVDPRPAGPFVALKGISSPTSYQRHLLGVLADSALECAALLGAMTTVHDLLQVGRHKCLDGANRAAVAKPHIDALIAELISLEELYGLELTNRVKRNE